MKSGEIREQMVQIESAETPRNLSPSEADRANIRAQKQLTLAVLEVAFQLAYISENIGGYVQVSHKDDET